MSRTAIIVARTRRGLLAVAVAIAAPNLLSQTLRPPVLHTWNSPSNTTEDWFGQSIACPGDLDGDGVPDVVVGAPWTNVGSASYAGRIYVYSGRDGSARVLDGAGIREALGYWSQAIGDIDRDGTPDFVCSFSNPGANVLPFSGRTLQRLAAIPQYSHSTGAGDVDRDGWPDLLLLAEDRDWAGQRSAGRVDLISGRDYSLLRRFTGGQYEGLVMGGPAGDCDRDGHPDLLVVRAGAWPTTTANGAILFSGRTGGVLYDFLPPVGGGTFGLSASGVGDVDADGHDDIGIGDWGSRTFSTECNVFVYGGRDGALLFVLSRGRSGAILRIAPAGDVDGDGFDDVLWDAGGRFNIESGRDQRVLAELSPAGTRLRALTATSVGDIDGDDFPDTCAGSFHYGASPPCFVQVYSGAMHGITTRGIGCADVDGVIPRIGATGSAELGTTLELHVSRVHAGQPALLAIGVSDTDWGGLALPLDLAPLRMSGCALRTSVEVLLATTTRGVVAEKGHATFAVTIPADPQLRGATFFAQWLVFGRGDRGRIGSTTRALAATIR